MWAEFDKLRRAWGARRQASGGTAALAGFQFQLAASLLALVREPVKAHRAEVFIEALSDLVTSEGGLIVVSQAKLTLHSSALQKALTELWEIENLAREHSTLSAKLRFRILTSRQAIDDVNAAIQRWHPISGYAPAQLSSFKQRTAVKVEEDPHMDLAAFLVNAFGNPDPFDTIERWIGQLLLNPNPDGFAETCHRISIDLDALEASARERKHQFYIWQSSDRPPEKALPEPNLSKAVLTGQIPTRQHLAEGRFGGRSVYQALHEKLEVWRSATLQTSDARLPVFWITGRSGSGKSVALLHALANLHQTGNRRAIVWLDQHADRLDQAITWSRPLFAEGLDVIFAADDPYTPERYERVASAIDNGLRELRSVAIAYEHSIRPSLILCGPSEQSQAFSDDLSDRVAIENFCLPEETKADANELLLWYRQRTGQPGFNPHTSDDALLVQVLFEWATGSPISEFALRFRQRLKAAPRVQSDRLFEIVAEILALNRLYALYPSSALNDELNANAQLGAAFDQIKESEHHLSLNTERSGYRLTHPHLANVLYKSWFGRPTDKRYRRAHLHAGLRAAYCSAGPVSQRLAPLWAIARLTSDKNRKKDDSFERIELIADELREVLVEIYNSTFSHTPAPLAELPVWTDLEANLQLGLTPAPLITLHKAVKGAHHTEAGLRLACHKLLEHRAELDGARQAVAQTLNRFDGWHDWAPLATDFLQKYGAEDIEDKVLEHISQEWMKSGAQGLVVAALQEKGESSRKIVEEWLAAAALSDRLWAGFFNQYIEIFGFSPSVHSLGWRFLRDFQEQQGWTHVWDKYFLLPGDRTLAVAAARTWLVSSDPAQSGWDRVWEKLWDLSGAADITLGEAGRSWLDRVPNESRSWAYVWRKLWVSEVNRENLYARAIEWLRSVSPRHGSWGFVWRDLWAAGRSDELLDLATEWLREAPQETTAWTYVWETVWTDSGDSRTDLGVRMLKWLRETPVKNPAWAPVWRALWGTNAFGATLIEPGIRWLEGASINNASWGLIFHSLWKRTTDPRLSYLGRSWLDNVDPAHAGWPHVWQALASEGALDLCLVDKGAKWLRVAPKHKGWRYVWQILLESPGGEQYLPLAIEWLDKENEHPSWGYIWKETARRGIEMSLWRSIGTHWLSIAPRGNSGWAYVWRALRAHAQDVRELDEAAKRWLAQLPLDTKGMALVWKLLWESAQQGQDERLYVVGWNWLAVNPIDTPGWRFIWNALCKEPLSHEQMGPLAGKALHNVPHTDPSWSFVWAAAWGASGGKDKGLRDAGLSWLSNISPNHRGWAPVWKSIWREGDPDTRMQLKDLGLAWLQLSSLKNSGWPTVWMTLWDYELVPENVLEPLGEHLLIKAPPRTPKPIKSRFRNRASPKPAWAWSTNWMKRWRLQIADDVRSDMVAEAITWLSKYNFQEGGWSTTWIAIWKKFHANRDFSPELVRLGCEWLKKASPGHPQWAKVWMNLWQHPLLGSRRSELSSAAYHWLQNVQLPKGWHNVWHQLWELNPSDQILLPVLSRHIGELNEAQKKQLPPLAEVTLLKPDT